VHADNRSKGVGHELISAVEAHCKYLNAEGLGVNCGQENIKAQEFYKREGFQQTGKVYNYFSNNNWQVFFWKKL